MADTGNCCGGPHGRHLKGCDGTSNSGSGRGGRKLDRAIVKRQRESAKYDANKARQQANAKLKNVGKPKSTAYRDVEIPQGHEQVKLPNGKYIIRKK